MRAHARTRLSNTKLRIGVCAVWNGFKSVYYPSQLSCLLHPPPPTFTYSSHTSMKNPRIPSSFFPSCNNRNFMSVIYHQSTSKYNVLRSSLPGVTNADTVHSLNLSTAFRYLITVRAGPDTNQQPTFRSPCASLPRPRPGSHSRPSVSHEGPVHRPPEQARPSCAASR